MVKLISVTFAVLMLLASGVRADDAERDRKARVALALTEAAPAKAAPAPKAACLCGDACNCAAGTCPVCPAAKAPSVTYREVWYSDGRRVWRQFEPVGEACPNGRCPLPR